MQVAHEKNVGSIIIGHSRHGRLHELVRGSIVQNLLRSAGNVDVHVVADPELKDHAEQSTRAGR
jgi:two-component system sensor histidine kinase KdpD